MQQTQTDKEKKKRQPATVKKQPDKQPAEQRGWGPAALSVVFFVFVILHLIWGDEQDSGIYAITAMFFAFLSGDYFSKARQNRRASDPDLVNRLFAAVPVCHGAVYFGYPALSAGSI